MQKLRLVPAAAAKAEMVSTSCGGTGKIGGQRIFCAGSGRSSPPCGAGARAAWDSGDRRGDPGLAL